MQYLEIVRDLLELIDFQGNAKEDLFNSQGTLLINKGSFVHSALFKMAVYCHKKNHQATLSLELPPRFDEKKELPDPERGQISMEPADLADFLPSQLNIKEVEKKIELYQLDRNVVGFYFLIKSKLQEIFNRSKVSYKSYEIAQTIINNTFFENRESWIKALWCFRTSDHCTADHSFSVYLLFMETMEDFFEHQFEADFFRTFKSLGAKINFDEISMRRYALGVLLHDFGKMSIQDKIVNKDSALTVSELDIIRLHPYYGVRALSMLGITEPEILDIVGNHHYHYRVNDCRQSTLAQIVNMIDIYDACRSGRSYKESFSFNRILGILEKENMLCNWDSFLYETIVKKTLPKIEEKIAKMVD